MSDHYRYLCSACGRAFAPAAIEGPPWTGLAPCCGRAQRNRPLEGVLLLEYDYPAARARLGRERFLRLPPGRPWLYPRLWPLAADGREDAAGAGPLLRGIAPALLERLALPALPPSALPVAGEGEALLLDESANPTFSFKDRASILVALKALQAGAREVSTASTGNAASSLAGICARAGLDAHIWVPAAIPASKLLQIQAYGARVYPVAGSYDEAFDLCLRVSAARGWLNRNTAWNPLTLEGKKSAAYDIFIGLGGELPDSLLVPAGDGVIVAGLHKGFRELRELCWIERLPRLFAVQAAGSDALHRYVDTGAFEYRPAATVADSLAAGAPRNLYLAARAVRESEGRVVVVTDEEILAAQAEAASKMGRLVEPAAAASLAGWRKLREEGVPGLGRALLLFTGNGLKDPAALARWIRPPAARAVDEWEEIFRQARTG